MSNTVRIGGNVGYALKARDNKGLSVTYYCNHGVCPYWDTCRVRLTDRIKDIHSSCPFLGA